MRSLVLCLCFLFATTPATAQSSGQEKQILLLTKANWLTVRDFNGKQLIYFTQLESWRCGISEVRYSVNSDALDQVWTLQPCDPANPNAITTDRPYVSLPAGTASSVSVQLTFKDGSKSEIVHIAR